MPRWFRLASALVMLATLVGWIYFRPPGPLWGGLFGLAFVLAGVMQFLILLSGRRATGADDPAQLNLHR